MIKLAVTIGITLLLTLYELYRPAVAGKADRLLSLQTGIMLTAVQIFAVPAIFQVTALSPLVDAANLPFWAGLVLFVLAMDLGEYLFHRAQHSMPWLWKLHSLHHSDPNMTALTANRHFWGDPILKSLTIWPLCAALVRPTPAMLAIYLWMGLWHTVVHANVKLSFGRWSWLLNSPAYHRRHHSSDPAHFNSNYSALFPIFDVISGAYRRPDGFPPTGQDRRPGNVVEAALWPVKV